MKEVMTNKEGWECVPEFLQLTDVIEQFQFVFYEIKHCVRSRSAGEMIELFDNMSSSIQEIMDDIHKLNLYDVKFVTKYDEE